MSLNRVLILGRLGADPELRYTASQYAVCSLRVATNDRKKNADGTWVDTTEWHSVSVFGKTAENCSKFLSKGRQVFVEGKLQTRKWQDSEGKDRYKTEIIANAVQFIGGGKGGESSERSSSSSFDSFDDAPPAAMTETVSFDDDEVPF
jgi:single-strand DNA-binding protein